MVTERPRGSEQVIVTCYKGAPEYSLPDLNVPYYRPSDHPMVVPDDFAGWVLVWINASQTPLIWYKEGESIAQPSFWLPLLRR